MVISTLFLLAYAKVAREIIALSASKKEFQLHASKGLEWEYVIIPRMNTYAFPTGHMCGPCREAHSCNNGSDYCKFLFGTSMEKAFKEEISVFYVAITRAKKNVFLTVNTGLNQWNYTKQTSCLIELPGLSHTDYDWENVIC